MLRFNPDAGDPGQAVVVHDGRYASPALIGTPQHAGQLGVHLPGLGDFRLMLVFASRPLLTAQDVERNDEGGGGKDTGGQRGPTA